MRNHRNDDAQAQVKSVVNHGAIVDVPERRLSFLSCSGLRVAAVARPPTTSLRPGLRRGMEVHDNAAARPKTDSPDRRDPAGRVHDKKVNRFHPRAATQRRSTAPVNARPSGRNRFPCTLFSAFRDHSAIARRRRRRSGARSAPRPPRWSDRAFSLLSPTRRSSKSGPHRVSPMRWPTSVER